MFSLCPLRPLPPDSVLGRIIASKRAEQAGLEAVPLDPDAIEALPPAPSFVDALSGPDVSLIAEFKPCSPSRGALRPAEDLEEVVAIYARYAAAISVLTDGPFFGGSLDLLRRARAVCPTPLLRKDFIIGERQLWEARRDGASAVLLMASVLDAPSIERLLELARRLGMEALVEVHDDEELEGVLGTSARVIGINNRDLRSLQIDQERFFRMAERVPRDRVVVCESGIHRASDVTRLSGVAHATLVGTTLMSARDVAAKIEELGWLS